MPQCAVASNLAMPHGATGDRARPHAVEQVAIASRLNEPLFAFEGLGSGHRQRI